MALTITFLVKEGEQVVASASNELNNELHLKDWLEHTLPGLEEHFKSLLAKAQAEITAQSTDLQQHMQTGD